MTNDHNCAECVRNLREIADRIERGEIAVATYSASGYDEHYYAGVHAGESITNRHIGAALLGMEEIRADLVESVRSRHKEA